MFHPLQQLKTLFNRSPLLQWRLPSLHATTASILCIGWLVILIGSAAGQVPVDGPPKVMVDSYHAHNFLHLGLQPGQYSYHRYTGLRRAVQLLKNRGCEVNELLVGPIQSEDLRDVDLFVVNLVSMDRPPFLVSEIQAIVEYVRGGGGILFVTDHSNCYYHQFRLLPLWTELGLIPTFETVCERDPNCQLSPNGNAWTLIRQWLEHPISQGVSAVAMQTSGRVKGKGQIAFTSKNAWADDGALPLYGEGVAPGLYGDLTQTAAEEQGSQAVILARDVGEGRVVVIADQNCIGDALIGFADNWRMWVNSAQWCGRLKFLPPQASPKLGLDFSLHCFDPFVVDEVTANGRTFDFASQDDNQFHHLWVWFNRHFWASCGPVVSRPSEVASGRPVLIGLADRLASEGFQSEIQKCLSSNGIVLVLAQQTTPEGFLSWVSTLRFGDGHKLSSIASALEARHFEVSQPVDSAQPGVSKIHQDIEDSPVIVRVRMPESGSSAGEVWVCLGAESLSNRNFASPSTQPDARQKHVEAWLLSMLRGIAPASGDPK